MTKTLLHVGSDFDIHSCWLTRGDALEIHVRDAALCRVWVLRTGEDPRSQGVWKCDQ